MMTPKTLAFLFVSVAIGRADMIIATDLDHADQGTAQYEGNGAPMSGSLTTNVLFSVPEIIALHCLGCELDFASGSLTGTDFSNWYFAGGGSVTLTGGVDLNDTSGLYTNLGLPDIPIGTALFTGAFDTAQAARCDAFTSTEVCILGTFSGALNPELAQVYGLSTKVIGLLVLNYAANREPPFSPFGCDAPFACGPLPPGLFEATTLGPGDSGAVTFSSAPVPEPSGLWLLATGVFLAAVTSRLRRIHRGRVQLPPDIDFDRTGR